METLNIYQRINAVMKDVQYVQKDSQVTGGGANYKAVTHDQLVSVIRSSLVKHGIVLEVKQTKGEFLVMRDVNATPQPIKMGLYSGWYDVQFVNMDNPEERTIITVEAHAADNGDKAPGKALTYAVKSAIIKQFVLETGENDESREEERDTDYIIQDQINEIFPYLCDTQGQYTEKGLKVAKAFKFNNLADIKTKKFPQILKAAQ